MAVLGQERFRRFWADYLEGFKWIQRRLQFGVQKAKTFSFTKLVQMVPDSLYTIYLTEFFEGKVVDILLRNLQ